MMERLPETLSDLTAPQPNGHAWDNMSMCKTCLRLQGEWTLKSYGREEGAFYQRCGCESDVPEGRQSRPRNWDTGIAVQLCRCCASILLPGGSRWNVWFC